MEEIFCSLRRSMTFMGAELCTALGTRARGPHAVARVGVPGSAFGALPASGECPGRQAVPRRYADLPRADQFSSGRIVVPSRFGRVLFAITTSYISGKALRMRQAAPIG